MYFFQSYINVKFLVQYSISLFIFTMAYDCINAINLFMQSSFNQFYGFVLDVKYVYEQLKTVYFQMTSAVKDLEKKLTDFKKLIKDISPTSRRKRRDVGAMEAATSASALTTHSTATTTDFVCSPACYAWLRKLLRSVGLEVNPEEAAISSGPARTPRINGDSIPRSKFSDVQQQNVAEVTTKKSLLELLSGNQSFKLK